MAEGDYLTKTLKALMLVSLDGRRQREQVDILDRAGFGQTDIADILGSTPKAISVRLAEVRSERNSKRGKKS